MRSRRDSCARTLAWSAHGYTALGLLAAAGIAVLLVRGSADSFRAAFTLMLVATVIDATDGALARWARVHEVLPQFDGRRLDDLIDFHTYTTLPLLLIWRADLLSGDRQWLLLFPLVASAYGFCQTSAKTDDGYFLGFPSYWNIVAFYLYYLKPLSEWLSVGLLAGFALLTMVPTRYIYSTQPGRLNRLMNWLSAIWASMLIAILAVDHGIPVFASVSARTIAIASLWFPVFYVMASWCASIRIGRAGRVLSKDRNA